MFVRALGLLLWLWSIPALAHDWYPMECCHERDCREIPPEQEPQLLQDGSYLLHDGIVVPKAQVKWSPDGKFHRCDVPGGSEAGESYGPRLICFFAPPPST